MADATFLPTSQSDLSERVASRQTRIAALGFALAALVIALVGVAFGTKPGPVIAAFVPVVAALWAAAELLTAYLLISQFTVNGVRTFLWLGAAYAVTGLLTIPYLAMFPGFLGTVRFPGAQQISLTLWVSWHLAFPIIAALGMLRENGDAGRVVEDVQIREACWLVLAAVVAACAVLTWVVVVQRSALPDLVSSGGFSELFTRVVAPAVVLANAGAACLIILRTARLNALHVWVAVALISAALDGLLNAVSGSRYTVAWYVGKLLTISAASIVLIALLGEVSALYRRVGALAMSDPLTGLRNRRSFDVYAAWALDLRRRQGGDVAMLMIDVDCFKSYNDHYGHAAGDECLARVGDVLRTTLRRRSDMIARYGGEEFAGLLPEATRDVALEIAEHLRLSVEALAIPHGVHASAFEVVTVSVGVAHAFDSIAGDPADLLALADQALYLAKQRRNHTVVETREAAAHTRKSASSTQAELRVQRSTETA